MLFPRPLGPLPPQTSTAVVSANESDLPQPQPQPQGDGGNHREASADTHVSTLFVNSFKISGIKHIADNILQSVLEGLPQKLA